MKCDRHKKCLIKKRQFLITCAYAIISWASVFLSPGFTLSSSSKLLAATAGSPPRRWKSAACLHNAVRSPGLSYK